MKYSFAFSCVGLPLNTSAADSKSLLHIPLFLRALFLGCAPGRIWLIVLTHLYASNANINWF
uniref:Uncharacterized protein n=1 Tax=Ascaris lumbricoides TaxID=6252 RepID=A0A0M3I895_ASCLU